MKGLVLLFYLLWLSVYDYKEKRVPVVFLVMGIVFALAYTIHGGITGKENLISLLMAPLPGLLLLFVAWITESVGWADGVVLLIIGFCTGYREGLFVLCTALLLISLLSIPLLIFKKVKKSTRLPFLPFMTTAYGIWLILAWDNYK